MKKDLLTSIQTRLKELRLRHTENVPTPQTLDEAIRHALFIGPMSETAERSYHVFKDFMAQKFGVAILSTASPETIEALETLFQKLTKRDAALENQMHEAQKAATQDNEKR